MRQNPCTNSYFLLFHSPIDFLYLYHHQIPICIYTLLPIYRLALISLLQSLFVSSLPCARIECVCVCHLICGVGGNIELTMWIVHLFPQYIHKSIQTHMRTRPPDTFPQNLFYRISSLKWQSFRMCVSCVIKVVSNE